MVRLAVLRDWDRRLFRSAAKTSVVVLRRSERPFPQWELSAAQN